MTSQEFLDDLWGSSEEKVPTKSSTFNSLKIAQYFQDQLQRSSWYTGFGIVNLRALAGQIARWKTTGLTAETAYAMVDAYMNNHKLRSKAPGWQDFINKRDIIATSLLDLGENTQLDNWDAAEENYDEEAAMRAYLERKGKL